MSDQSAPRQAPKHQPLMRFVISIDGQRKMSYADRGQADAEAARLRAEYPVPTVLVSDQDEALIRDRT